MHASLRNICQKYQVFVIIILVFHFFYWDPYCLLSRCKPLNDGVGNGNDVQQVESKLKHLSNCDTIELVYYVYSDFDWRNISISVKSVLQHRQNPIQLHIVTNTYLEDRIKTLFETWDIVGLQYEIHIDESDVSRFKTVIHSLTRMLSFKFHTGKVIVLNSLVVFHEDIAQLWELFAYFPSNHGLGMVGSETKSPNGFYYDIILVDIAKYNGSNLHSTLSRKKIKEWSELKSVVVGKSSNIFRISCEWLVRTEPDFSIERCLKTKLAQASFNKPVQVEKMLFLGLPEERITHMEVIQNQILSIASYNGDMFRHDVKVNSRCLSDFKPKVREIEKCRYVCGDNKCQKYETDALMLRRTMPFYYVDSSYTCLASSKSGVILTTVFTMDRFTNFESLVRNWPGKISASIYVTDSEANQLLSRVRTSIVISSRSNIAIHAVYRRGKLFPINYLRNVATKYISACDTYVFYNDVDLTPWEGTFQYLLNLVSDDPSFKRSSKSAYIVPAFEAKTDIASNFPKDKSELKEMYQRGTIVGYGEGRWAYGHKNTNFQRWMNTTSTYTVIHSKRFEPYVLIKADSNPAYEEALTERSGDKSCHIYLLNKKGFEFVVLPEAFLIHQLHVSTSSKLESSDKTEFKQCGFKIERAYRKLINDEL